MASISGLDEEDLVDYYGMLEGDSEQEESEIIELEETVSGSVKRPKRKKTCSKDKEVVALEENQGSKEDEDYNPKKSQNTTACKTRSKRKEKALITESLVSEPGVYEVRKQTIFEMPQSISGPLRLNIKRPVQVFPVGPSGMKKEYCDLCQKFVYYVSENGWEKHLKTKHGDGDEKYEDDDVEADRSESPEVMIIPDEECKKPEPEVVDLEDDDGEDADDDDGEDADDDDGEDADVDAEDADVCAFYSGGREPGIKPPKSREYQNGVFQCGTCDQNVAFADRKKHKCFYYVKRGYPTVTDELEHTCTVLKKTIKYASQSGLNKHFRKYHSKKEKTGPPKVKSEVVESEHNCTVLQKILRFATLEAYTRHCTKYHEETDVNGKVYLQDDGSLAVLEDDTDETEPPLREFFTNELVEEIYQDLTRSGNSKQQKPTRHSVKKKKRDKKNRKLAKNKKNEGAGIKNRLREMLISKQHSRMSSKLIARASKHMNAVNKNTRQPSTLNGSPSKLHKCSLCSSVYGDVKDLVVHTQKWHFTKFFNRVCKLCNRWFSYFALYKVHTACYSTDRTEQGCWKVCIGCHYHFETLKEARDHITAQGTKCKQGETNDGSEPMESRSGEGVNTNDDKGDAGDDEQVDVALGNGDEESSHQNESNRNERDKSIGGVQVEYMYKEDSTLNSRCKDNPDYRTHWLLR